MRLKKEVVPSKPKKEKTPYKEGSQKLIKLISLYEDEIYKATEKKAPPNYFTDKLYSRNNLINEIIDKTTVHFLKSIQQQNIISNPFEYFLFAVMERADRYDQKDDRWGCMQAAACRLIDTHYYWAKAKSGDANAKQVLVDRGWYGKKDK